MLKMQIIGHLGKDCEVKGHNEFTVINFDVAHSENYTDKQGVKQSKTTWVSCAIWKKDGQSIKVSEFLKKGTLVMCEGTPKTRAWNDKDSLLAKSILSLTVDRVELLGAAKPKTEADTNKEADQSAYQADDLPF